MQAILRTVTVPWMRLPLLSALAGLALCWGVAIALYPELPERFPVHFRLDGTPDRFAARSPSEWYLLPGIATVLVALFGWLLPIWIRRLAANNSPYLNVPDKTRFATLPAAARVRAVTPMLGLLQAVACELTLLFAAILIGTAKVASGAWEGLPPWLPLLAVPILSGTALLAIPVSKRAIARELAAQAQHP
jgi:uncharacterized membrane protein